ncbi:MAG TPA: molybdate ABC transporter substrate-binding protein [Vicinamibacterales bacterium]|nr:molybdate ABC transporter substrate-binding protein [Vicinamibacterales bacterium]
MPDRRRRLCGWITAALLVTAVPARAQLAVAAASDLQPVLPDIAARFQRVTGQPVSVSFGSSGHFAAQIRNGAPFDVFLSADESHVQVLIDSGYAVRGSVVHYATGRLALWSRSDRGLDLSPGLRALADPRVRRIAIANPDHAPYGRAAIEALRTAGLDARLRDTLVLGESVSQAAQFALTGNADVGIIAVSLTRTPAMQAVGRAVEIAPGAYPVIRQSGVVLARAHANQLATRFLAFVTSPEIAAVLVAAGFGAPQ